MEMTVETNHFTLCGKALRGAAHVCAFFNSDEEAYRATIPFIRDGIEEGEKAVHMLDPDRVPGHLATLSNAGIDVDGACKSKQLEVLNWNESYLLEGRFDTQRMISFVEDAVVKTRQEGYPCTRIFAAMEWANTEKPGVEQVVEYEARVHDLFNRHEFVAICAYDLRKHKSSVVMDILRTHPYVIIGGILQENPFFVPPAQFLSELRQRQIPRVTA
jgi:hypothetical protein